MSSQPNGEHEQNGTDHNHNKKSTKIKKSEKFVFGNYQNYYYKRLGAGETKSDFRVDLLSAHPEYFTDKRVLDIGCNEGFVTISLARRLLPKSILGVDIDGSLIEKARKELEREKAEERLNKDETEALGRVIFRKANYILKDESLLEFEKPQYDAILCLSITKWIHLNYGDNGIKFMFRRIFKQLNPNGILILEAQNFETYRKRSKLSQEILKNYKNIQLRPEKFEQYLLSDEIGFAESMCLADKEILKASGQTKGFRRPLQVFMKR